MTKFAQRFGFDLADALAGDIKLFTHLFQRLVSVHLDTEAHPQYLGFPLCQAVQNIGGCAAQAIVNRRIDRHRGMRVFDEITQV